MRLRLLLVLALLLPSLAFARGGGGCFLPGTLVETISGQLPIEKLEPGQSVLAFGGGSLSYAKISEIYAVERDFHYEISAGGEKVRVTAEHPFYVGQNRFIEASNLHAGDTVYLLSGGKLAAARIDSALRIEGPSIAYNLRTESPHTFIAGGFAVHNKGCFPAGTIVLSPYGNLPIESVKIGDRVYSFSEEKVSVSRVVKTYSVMSDGFYEISAGGKTVRATESHPFLTFLGFVEAKDLVKGDAVYLFSNGALAPALVKSISFIASGAPAYNIEVEGDHTFIAGGFAVHNKGGCFSGGTEISCPNGTTSISEIGVGDSVLSFEGGVVIPSVVSEKYSLTVDEYYSISTGSRTVNATAEHPFYTPGGYVEAQNLQVGDTVFVRGEGGSLSQETVTGKVLTASPITVYNLQVGGAHTFFANDFAVHNKGCFLPGTRVLSSSGEVKIESLKEGDTVYSFSESGAISLSRVSAKFTVSRDSYYRILAGGAVVLVTAEHPFFTGRGYKNAEELRAGDMIFAIGPGGLVPKTVESSSLIMSPTVAYNLEVDNDHTFFANGFAVHNKGGSSGSRSSGPPPNMFYYDCNKTYDKNGVQTACCRQASSSYIATTSLLSKPTIANAQYPYCGCVVSGSNVRSLTFMSGASKCSCTNSMAFDPANGAPFECPLDVGAVLFAFIVIGSTLAVGFYANKATSGKYVLHIIVIGFLALFFEVILFGLTGILEQIMEIVPFCCFGIYLLVIVGSVITGKKNFDLSSLTSGEWSSTAAAPQGKVKAKAGKVGQLLSFWAKVDPAWDEAKLKETAKATFLKLQDCWSRREYAEMEPLLAPSIFAQHTAQLEAMASRHEINRMEDLKLLDTQIVLVKRFEKKEKDEFTAWFRATAKDTIIDDRTGKKIRGDLGMGTFEEFWTFARSSESWLLREIDQPEEGMHVVGEESFDEAATPNMMKTIQERATTGKENTSVSAIREQGGEIGAPAIGEIKEKGDKIHRMLNFLSQSDRIWDERKMLETARTMFILLNTSVEKRNITKVSVQLSPALAATVQSSIDEMKRQGRIAQKGNLAVRNVEIVLVRNFNDRKKDEFTAWISGQAQNCLVDEKTGKRTGGDSYVRDFEEYWTFMRDGDSWKLSSIDGSADAVSKENLDEGVSRDMLQWYYWKDRAI